MRLNLDLEELHVETTVMQPEFAEGEEGYYAASILWNTTGHQVPAPDTNSSPCVA
jgi:hypothetical protein